MKKNVLAVTRFNEETFIENCEYKRKRNFPGCIYGVPVKISETIEKGSQIIVIEMNIGKDIKKICGIGVIKNDLDRRICCNIYSLKRYNKYIYYSKYRIDANDFHENELEILKKISDVLFKSKSHVQRGVGITKVPIKNINRLDLENKTSNLDFILSYIIQMFNNRLIYLDI